ncbi:MAG: MBL fold metallo-hydrolase [Clostridia bacterium]|nr:MBL fold metallo-hydrolase [Clostridia bacterium]
MQASFLKIADDLYRLDIPFDHLFTSVCLLDGENPIIIDAATTRADVQSRILPALRAMRVTERSGTLLLTHRHGDHSGGAPFLLEVLPSWKLGVLSSDKNLGRVTAIPLGGHTEDSMGYLDTRTGTLLAGDALQFFGVGKYGCSVVDASLYEATLARVASLAPNAILPSHDFIGGSAAAIGQTEVTALLDAARITWEEIKSFILQFPTDTDPFEVVRAWKAERTALPPLPSTTVKAVRKANQ